jgi:hypothetical protein
VLVAVGIEDDRPPAELRLQAIGVKLRLLLAHAGVAPSALGLDQRERLAVVAPEHIVHGAPTLLVGHAADFELAILRLIERPDGLLEQQIDEIIPGFCENRRTRGLAESGVVNEGAEVVLVGELEGRIVLVEPVHRQLEHPPRVEARAAGIGAD